jgi:hypothetical protein
MNEAQKWVLGLILLILLLHWLLPSGSKPSRLSTIWKAAFSPGSGSPTAPTTAPNLSVPALGSTGPGQNVSISGNAVNPGSAAKSQALVENSTFNGFIDTYNNVLMMMAAGPPTIPDGLSTTMSSGGANHVTVFGRLLNGGVGPQGSIFQAEGHFSFIDPTNPTRTIYAFSPNLQGKLLAAGSNPSSGIILPQNFADSLNAEINKLSAAQANSMAKANAVTPAGGGPSSLLSMFLHGVN